MQRLNRSNVFAIMALTLVALVIAALVQQNWQTSLLQAKSHFVTERKAESRRDMARLNNGLRSIYENLRTIASLPSLATVDRQGSNLSAEARVTIQQIYNNLATNISVSEVYIVPINFSPHLIDPVTGKGEEPIEMFDQLIVNPGADVSRETRQINPESIEKLAAEGPEEVEQHEYLQLVDQATWLKRNFPTRQSFKALEYPIISGQEVITCDNTDFIKTGLDKDRMGLMFSVPFYDASGQIKGMVTAIVLSNALQKLLPNENSALINPGNSYSNIGQSALQMPASLQAILSGVPDDKLIYSEVVDVKPNDARNPYSVWVGVNDEKFTLSPEVADITFSYWRNMAMLVGLYAVCLAAALLLLRNLTHEKALNKKQELEHQLELTRFAETEARLHAAELFEKSKTISALNSDLNMKIAALKAAQEEVVAKSKMAQLGSLVATVAHEIRNPLGSVRTSNFILKRRIKADNDDLKLPMQRIEDGIERCDRIISQLLDFSSNSKLVLRKQVLDDWLARLVQRVAESYPAKIAFSCVLGTGDVHVDYDSERLGRVVENLILNAVDALSSPAAATIRGGHGAAIAVSTTLTKRGVEISISDNGPGIPFDLLEKVKEPLFTTKNFGTGLGIPSAIRVLDQHSGGLELLSRPGEGLTCCLWLPLEQATTEAA